MQEFNDESRALPGLIGQPCDQVWFVQDYVMIILQDYGVTCVTDPEIEVAGARYTLPEPGSRDALCALIGKSVEAAAQLETGTVELRFTEGLTVRVSPWAGLPDREFIYIGKRTW